MLRRERFEMIVGLVFVAAILTLIAGLLWAKRFRLHQETLTLHVSFTSVGGLGEGDQVLVSGMRMGSVSEVRLRERDVLVSATVSEHISIYDDYAVRITPLTFTGEMGLLVEPGQGDRLSEPYGELKGVPPYGLHDLMQPGLETLAAVKTVADTLAWALPQVVRRTHATLDHLDSVLLVLGQGVEDTKTDVRQTLGRMRSTLSQTGSLLASLEARLDTSLLAADEALASVKATSDSFRVTLAEIDTRNGTLGRAIHDPSLYDELRRAVTRLDSAAVSMDSLMQDVKRNPKRYVRFSLF